MGIAPTTQQQTPGDQPRGATPGEIFVARQPILDRHQRCYAYELLFRGGSENFFPGTTDGDRATRCTVNSGLNLIGLDDLVGEKRAFINITRNLLLDGMYELLPTQRVVVELLEDIEPDSEVIAACHKVRELGYTLAIDDFVLRPDYDELLAIADIIKVDLRDAGLQESRQIIEMYSRPDVQFLAEKVESPEEFTQARHMGYHLFQGYYFSKPQVVQAQDIPANKLNYFMFLRELITPEIDFDAVAKIVKREASLLVKLLKYLNSAALGVRHRVTSIPQALALLGERPLRQWGSLVAATCMGDDKPAELNHLCMARARFCELIAPRIGMKDRELDLFLMGLLSAMDAVLDYPVAPILAQLPLPIDIKSTLMGDQTDLSKLKLLMQACEHGKWDNVAMMSKLIGVDEILVARLHMQSNQWADQMAQA